MEEKGMGIDWILDILKALAEKSRNDAVRLGAVREAGDYYGAKEKAKEIIRGQVQVFEPFGQDELAKIEAHKVQTLEEVDSD